jgi:putative MATE family efflux protein
MKTADAIKSSSNKAMMNTPVTKLLLKMSLPMMIAMVVNGLYYLVDAAFIGNFVGSDGVAALGIGFPIDMFGVALAVMFAVGTAAVLSVKLGKQEREKADAVLKNAIMLTSAAGIVLSAVLFAFKNQLFTGLGATGSVYSHADNYYSVMIPGMILVFLSFLGTNSVRAEGNAILAASGMVSGAVINIVLDAVFVMGFRMGTAGAALGTVIARAVTVILYFIYYMSGRSSVCIKKGKWRIDLSDMGLISKIGFGAFLNQVSFSFMAVIVNLVIKQHGTPMDFSVFGIVSRIIIFITMPLSGIGQGSQVVAGYNYGAGNSARVKRTVYYGYLYSVLFGLILWIFLFFFTENILLFFTSDPNLIRAGIEPLRTSTILVVLIGIQIITYYYFISVHKVLNGMVTSICRQLLFLIPFVLILPLFTGIKGVWAAFPVSDLISAIFCLILIKLSLAKLPVKESAQNT